MDFLLAQQARHDHEIAQIRRILISGIRIARRDRAEFREKLNILLNAQMGSEDELIAFRNESRAGIAARQAETLQFRTETRENIAAMQAETLQFQTETRNFQAETREAFSLLTHSLAETNERVDAIEDSIGNGDRPEA